MPRRLRPRVDREAILALALAGLGFVAMYTTLPAAVMLGVRALRSRRTNERSEPALGALILAVTWLSFLLGYPAMRAIVMTGLHAQDDSREWGFAGGLVVLSAVILLLARYLIRIHPERWVARRAAVAGIVAAVAAAFLQAVVVTTGLGTVAGSCGTTFATNADCLGTTPWIGAAPALAVGVVWFAMSVATQQIQQLRLHTR